MTTTLVFLIAGGICSVCALVMSILALRKSDAQAKRGDVGGENTLPEGVLYELVWLEPCNDGSLGVFREWDEKPGGPRLKFVYLYEYRAQFLGAGRLYRREGEKLQEYERSS